MAHKKKDIAVSRWGDEGGATRSPRSESRKHMIRRACSLCAKNLKTCLRMLCDHIHFPYLPLLQIFK